MGTFQIKTSAKEACSARTNQHLDFCRLDISAADMSGAGGCHHVIAPRPAAYSLWILQDKVLVSTGWTL